MYPPNTTHRKQELLAELQHFPNIFSKLSSGENSTLAVKVNVAGFSGLAYVVNDLLRAALLTLEADCDAAAGRHDANPNAATLIDLALQLMPIQELELVDILHRHHLEKQNQQP
jgi:hypothetical protein